MAAGPDKPEYLTVAEVAHRLRREDSTVRGWIQEGRLAAYRFGKAWLIRRDDLEAFEAAARRGETPGGLWDDQA